MKVTLNVMFCFFNYFYLMELKENIALLVDKMIYSVLIELKSRLL